MQECQGQQIAVTSAVLNGIDLCLLCSCVCNFWAIDGLFDMGRTATNVTGGVFAATLVAKDEGLFERNRTNS
nr:cation:dicarboxylase symporter family transporter [Entomoplasma sp. MP1]